MGTRGPQPKPTALRGLQGGKKTSHRPENKEEPKPKLAKPKKPGHLDAEAGREWDRVSDELLRLGLLSVVDRAALAAYCAAWSRWVKAEAALKRQGLVIKTKTGYPVTNPWLAISNKALAQMSHFLSMFGLSPSSRVGLVGSGKGKSASPIEEFLNRQREKRASAAARRAAAAARQVTKSGRKIDLGKRSKKKKAKRGSSA